MGVTGSIFGCHRQIKPEHTSPREKHLPAIKVFDENEAERNARGE